MATCDPVPLATIKGEGTCASDAECGAGFCAANGVCQTITSGTCSSDTQCPLGSSCNAGTCVYPAQPVYAGVALGPDNFWPYLRMYTTLTANLSTNEGPTVFDWALTYLCRSIR